MKKKRIYNHVMTNQQKLFLEKILASSLLNEFSRDGKFFDFCDSHDLGEWRSRGLDSWHCDIKSHVRSLIDRPTYCDYDRKILNAVREYFLFKDEILKTDLD